VTDREKGDGSETFDPFAAPPPPDPTAAPIPEPSAPPAEPQLPPSIPTGPIPPRPGAWGDRPTRPPGHAAPPTPAFRPPDLYGAPQPPEPPAEQRPGPIESTEPPQAPPEPSDPHGEEGTTPVRPDDVLATEFPSAGPYSGPGAHEGAPPVGPPRTNHPDHTVVYERRNAYGPPPMRDQPPGTYGPPAEPGAPPPPWQRAPQRPTLGAPGPYGPPGAMPPGQWTGEPPRQGEQGRWVGGGEQPGAAQAPRGGPVDYNYVDRIRSSELVRTRKIPPARGWRRGVLKASFGLINLGQSPDERRQAELEAKIRSLLRGRYKIGVLGKGGTGKTTIAASVGSLLAELRQEDRVVAIDADTAFGKLGSRVDPKVSGSYWELASDQHLDTFADVRSRVGNNTSGLFVLPGERSSARRRVLDPAIYREATARLDNHFTISIVDCGSTMDSPVTREALQDLDALIMVSSPWVDGASAAGQTMDWLANNGYTGLLHRTVVVLNDSDGHADKRTRNLLVEQLSSGGQTVIEVPFDGHLRPGGVIDVDNELNPETRRRLVEIAAALAEHFPATTDRPRERR
jgi:MinD-like ATPase involved in chromosome partitioning or flagellar assembly